MLRARTGARMNVNRVLTVLLLALVLAIPRSSESQSKDQLGKVDFANSCSPAVQASFQRSVAMLHSFWYNEAEKSFREVLVQDPSCGIATWGIAAILMSNPLAGIGPSPEGAARAQAATDQGRKIGAKTQRERDYIEAVAAKYPSDDEAHVFYALYLAGTQSLADQTYATYLKAAGILEVQFARHPDHPGIAHYLIHSYDAPPIAPKGLPAARLYAGIAPSAPHALHMPSHIFTRVGAWTESAATNERSAVAAKRDRDFDEQLHAMDYMVYAYLQLARDADARRVLEDSATASGVTTLRFAGPYAQSAMPARYAVERGDWKQAAGLTPNPSQWPFTVALTYYARALGAARSGDPAAAEQNVQELVKLRDALKAAKSEYWATEVEVSRVSGAAWTALAQGKPDEALALMRAAADMEDKSEKHIVTPGRIVPAREALGDMLLEVKRPADALKEYEASQVREPERFRGYYGAARAAAQAGDKLKARRYYAKLVAMADPGSTRPEAAQARAFLAANP